jgi:tripartite-type tricarboxylate transporter receptor subunit TctC
MILHRLTQTIAAVAIAGCLTGAANAAESVADFYRGKQISLILSTGPGGGYELYARPLAQYMSRHIPGHPNIVVQNMEGGGGLRALNYLYNIAAKDGSVIGMVHDTVAFAPLYGIAQAKFDATKVDWLGSLNAEGAVCIGWHTAAVKTLDDLLKKPFLAGSTGPGSDMSMYANALNHLAGAKIKIISGYKGANDIYLAMEKGEVDGRCGTAISGLRGNRPQWFAQKLVNFIVQTAVDPIDDPALKDTPLIIDRAKDPDQRAAWKFLFAAQKMARPVLAPPGIPADRLAALRQAVAETARDPDFLAEMAASKSAVHYLSGEAVLEHIKDIYATPERVQQIAIKAAQP